jgi:hypothetical protein
LPICRFLRNYIGFTFALHFPTTEEVGNFGATNQYVDDRLKQLNNGTDLTIIKAQQASNNTMITNLSNQVQTNNATISRLNSEINAIKRSISF